MNLRRKNAPPAGQPAPGRQTPQGRPRLPWLWFVVLLIINFLVATLLSPSGPQRVDVPYTFFKQQARAGNVVEIVGSGDTIQGTFRQQVTYPPAGDPDSIAGPPSKTPGCWSPPTQAADW